MKSIHGSIAKALIELGIRDPEVRLEHPENVDFGDFTTNVAMVYAKQLSMSPMILAEEIREVLESECRDLVSEVSVANPGFINITLHQEFFRKEIRNLLDQGESYGSNDFFTGKHIIVEYTDPNPFKEFHIGHLMTNTIGESLACLFEIHGARVTRMNYQGDVGLHVAKAIWGMMEKNIDPNTLVIQELGVAYQYGANQYEENDSAKTAIDAINKKVYEKSDDTLSYYSSGRKVSLDRFEELYRILGSTFDSYIYESEVSDRGKEIVLNHVGDVFEEGDGGAIVYRGEKKGLHTRVFITGSGLPTYEGKEIGLDTWKFEQFPDIEQSVIVTGGEQSEFMKVVMAAFEDFKPEIAEKTKHITHGLMLGADGKKVSSRKGTGITGESLIEEVVELAKKKIENSKKEITDSVSLAQDIAVAAIKYSILKQRPGQNIVFDFDTSLSFEGDSGPYLQYTYARISSLMKKGSDAGLVPGTEKSQEVTVLERLLARFPGIVARALQEFSPQHIAGYLIAIAREFNSYYGSHTIIDEENKGVSSHRLAIALATQHVLRNGLQLLGIRAPEAM